MTPHNAGNVGTCPAGRGRSTELSAPLRARREGTAGPFVKDLGTTSPCPPVRRTVCPRQRRQLAASPGCEDEAQRAAGTRQGHASIQLPGRR